MEDIITVRFETGDEARAAAASLADSVNENDIFILSNNQPGALDSDRDAARTNDQGSAKGGQKRRLPAQPPEALRQVLTAQWVRDRQMR